MGLLYTVVSNLGNFSRPMSLNEARRYARTLRSLGNKTVHMKTSEANKVIKVMGK